MNIDTLASRDTARRPSTTSAGTTNSIAAPSDDHTAGRGRSVGNSNTGTPASRSRQ
jgi:hypothetical protein